MAAPTWQELYNSGKAEAILRRPDLSVRSGDVSDMLLAGGAAMGDRVIGYVAERVAATFLDGARGADLTKLADDHWGVQRQEAVKAIGTVTFTRSGADATATEFPIGTVVATERDSAGNEVRYLTTAAASWAVSTNGDRTVATQAEVAGTTGNLAAVDLVTRIISTPPAGGTYELTASTVAVGGAPEESDPDLRDRVRAITLTQRRGTLQALEIGALQIDIVKRATAVDDGTGLVTVYVTDADGGSTGADVTVSPSLVDDGTMTYKVAIELLEWAAAGSLVNVSGGTVQTVDITVALTVRLGVDVPALVALVQSSIAGAVNRLKIGETLYKSLIQAAARAVDPDNILEVTVSLPATDTAPTTAGHIIRAGTVTVS